MRILVEANKENQAQLKDDLERLQSEIVLPMQVASWEVRTHNQSSWKHAETVWDKETNEAKIKFFNRYFREKSWKKRITTFLHELAHIYLFFSEEKCSDWIETLSRLRLEKIQADARKQRYNIEMANWIAGYLYPEILALPLEFLVEECFKQKFLEFFHFRTDAYYDLKNEWELSFEEWKEKAKWNGSELVAPYDVYRDLLKVRHFLKIVNKDDLENLSRFGTVYQKRKHLLNTLCNEGLLQYFTENEDKLTTVSLSPLYFSEKGFLELSNRLWNFPRTS